MILVDTGVWVELFRGADSPPRRQLSRLIEEEEDLALTGIVVTEILQGITRERDVRTIRDFLLEFPIFEPKGLETYLSASQIYRQCRRKGKTIRKTVDCIIAAVCLENDLILLHKDSDFDRIASCTGLKCYRE
jgi:hypothetical protein